MTGQVLDPGRPGRCPVRAAARRGGGRPATRRGRLVGAAALDLLEQRPRQRGALRGAVGQLERRLVGDLGVVARGSPGDGFRRPCPTNGAQPGSTRSIGAASSSDPVRGEAVEHGEGGQGGLLRVPAAATPAASAPIDFRQGVALARSARRPPRTLGQARRAQHQQVVEEAPPLDGSPLTRARSSGEKTTVRTRPTRSRVRGSGDLLTRPGWRGPG